MRNRVGSIYMIGIGGSGMSGIAEILLNLGYEVYGSDMSSSKTVANLQALGANIYIGHDAKNVQQVDVVVKSTAISDDNPEIVQAKSLGIPVIARAEMLAELMRLRRGIAVAGTHGKTTTTSFVSAIFDEAALDPTVVIGGLLNAYGSNAHLGSGDYLIAEADESDGSFLCLFSLINIVTNIDKDHIDFYGDQEAIDKAFIQFMNSIPFYGLNVVCGDDAGIQRLISQVKRPVMTYGFEENNRIRAEVIECARTSCFKVFLDNELLGEVTLSQPGKHNVLNALAAIGVALDVGIEFEVAARGLSNFGGVGRRFELKGEKDGVIVIDDYGHHPVEIKATVETMLAAYPDRRLVVAFQPHRFSRTQALFGDFCTCFAGIDKLLLTEIYGASESPIAGVNGLNLAQGIKQVSKIEVDFYQDMEELASNLNSILQEGDIFLTLGAGSITNLGPRFLA